MSHLDKIAGLMLLRDVLGPEWDDTIEQCIKGIVNDDPRLATPTAFRVLPTELELARRVDGTILAVKMIRERLGLGLKEAKYAIERAVAMDSVGFDLKSYLATI